MHFLCDALEVPLAAWTETRRGRHVGENAHRGRGAPRRARAAQPTDESPVEEELHLTEEADVSLGPLFTLGAVLLIYGLLRRRPLVMAAGIASVWLDQRTELGRSLKERVRGTVEEKIKARALG